MLNGISYFHKFLTDIMEALNTNGEKGKAPKSSNWFQTSNRYGYQIVSVLRLKKQLGCSKF